jgi:hypothetical protein
LITLQSRVTLPAESRQDHEPLGSCQDWRETAWIGAPHARCCREISPWN